MMYPCCIPIESPVASPVHRCAWSYDFDDCLDSSGSGGCFVQRSAPDCLGAAGGWHRFHGKNHGKIHYKWKNPGLKWIKSKPSFVKKMEESTITRGCSSHGPAMELTTLKDYLFFFWPEVGKLMELF